MKLQVAIEVMIIISVVALVALIMVFLYSHSTSNINLPKTNEVLNAEYFISGNGQPICGHNVLGQYGNYIATGCLVFVTSNPLPPWNNFTQAQIQKAISNQTYFNQLQNSDRYLFGFKTVQHVIGSQPWGGGRGLYTGYDNLDDLVYLGKVNNYYEYMMFTQGFPMLLPEFNLEEIQLREYTPNITAPFSSPTKIIDILPEQPGLIVHVIKTNNTVGSIPAVGEFMNLSSNVGNATITISGAPPNTQITLTYNFSNMSIDGYTSKNTITITTSNTPFSIQVPVLKGENYTVTISPNTIQTSNGEIYVTTPSLTYTYGSNIDFNYHVSKPITLEYTLNKPLVPGAQVYFALPNTTFFYPTNPYSNLVVTVGNTIQNGGTPVDVFIANYTQTSITLNIGNAGNAQTVYLNFLPVGNTAYTSYLSYSPDYMLTNPGMSYTPGSGIFSTYNSNIPANWQLVPINNTWYYITLVQNIKPNIAYTIGMSYMYTGSVDSVGFNNSQISTGPQLRSNQAPYNGIYVFGSGGVIQFGQAYWTGVYKMNLTNPITSYSSAPITMAYYPTSNTIVEEIYGPDVHGNITETYSTTNEFYSDFIPLSLSAYQAFGNTGLMIIAYLATDPSNIIGYTSTYVGVVQ